MSHLHNFVTREQTTTYGGSRGNLMVITLGARVKKRQGCWYASATAATITAAATTTTTWPMWLAAHVSVTRHYHVDSTMYTQAGAHC